MRTGFLIHMSEDNPLKGRTLVEMHFMQMNIKSILEKRRWLILLTFSIFSFSNSMIWITYSSVAQATKDYYSIGDSGLVEFSNSFMYAYFLLSMLGSYLTSKYFAQALFGSIILNLVGSWLRYFAAQSFLTALIGQYIAAIAQNVILFTPVIVAERWFSSKESLLAVAIGSLVNILGWGCGFILPPIIMNQFPDPLVGMPKILYIEAIIATLPLILGIFTLRSSPKIPPNHAALTKILSPRAFWSDLKFIIKDWRFMLSALCFANVIGQQYTLSSVIALFIDQYTVLTQGLVGFTFIIAGVISGLFSTGIVNKGWVKNYDKVIKFFIHMSLLCLILMATFIHSSSLPILYLLNAVVGIGFSGFQPFGIESLIETSFPKSEVLSVNIMMMFAQLFGLAGNYLSTASFIGKQGIFGLCVLLLPSWIYSTFFFKTKYNRKSAEEAAKLQDLTKGKEKKESKGNEIQTTEQAQQQETMPTLRVDTEDNLSPKNTSPGRDRTPSKRQTLMSPLHTIASISASICDDDLESPKRLQKRAMTLAALSSQRKNSLDEDSPDNLMPNSLSALGVESPDNLIQKKFKSVFTFNSDFTNTSPNTSPTAFIRENKKCYSAKYDDMSSPIKIQPVPIMEQLENSKLEEENEVGDEKVDKSMDEKKCQGLPSIENQDDDIIVRNERQIKNCKGDQDSLTIE